jgi:hypothetical protein
MGTDGRWDVVRRQHEIDREVARTRRMTERGTREARHGMRQLQQNIELSDAAPEKLGKKIAEHSATLIPK